MKILFISGNPIRRNIVLCLRERQLPRANEFAKMCFKGVFDMSIPRSRVRLRPEITGIVGPAKVRINQIIKFVVPILPISDTVLLKDFFSDGSELRVGSFRRNC